MLAREIFHAHATRARPQQRAKEGGECLAHRLDLLWAKRRIPSKAPSSDLGLEQFVVYGDLAHLGFQPGNLVVAVIAFFFQGCRGACEVHARATRSAWCRFPARTDPGFPLRTDPA